MNGEANNRMLRIVAETAYPPMAASPRVRILSFAPLLAGHGVHVDFMPTLTDHEYRVISAPGCVARKLGVLAGAAAKLALRPRPPHDGLWVHRLGFLVPVPGVEPRRKPDIYDLDDALFMGSISQPNRRFARVKRDAERCAWYLRSARLVIAANAYLADAAREYATRVEIVPSCVDCSRQLPHRHADKDIVTVGWIGSRTTSDYLQEVLPVFERLNANGVRAKLLLVGAELPITAPWLEQRRWSLRNQFEDIADFDIGIMPLPQDDWTRGKSGYKLLQYFAAEVPAVASPVGINTQLVGDTRGYLARSQADWYQALRELVDSVTIRREMGINGRALVEAHYSYEHWAPYLAELIRSAVTGVSPSAGLASNPLS